ncbi:MAG TPA: YihY/virulence factor BrkB family protein [Candidatus Limnocylindria bacterium]|nr:YihY/virulence factor BrkB family protein [Candidatus Limnocylindria bacterium]
MIDRVKHRFTRIRDGIDRWVQRHRVTRVARRAAVGFMDHEALQYAGSMAYFAILSIFQLIVLGVTVGALFLGEGTAREFVLDQIRLNTPINADAVGRIIDNIIQSRGGIGLISLAFLVWGALGFFSALSRGISRAFVKAQPRPFLQDKLIGLLLMAVTGGMAIAALALGVVIGVVQDAAAAAIARVPGANLALSALGLVVPLLLVFVALLIMYRVVPNRPLSIAMVWPGAVVAAILWSVLRVGFTYYATHIARYDSAFGPISTGISLLVFLYFASVVLLVGAEVARANAVEMD